MAIRLADTAVPMNDTGYPVARAKHIWFDDNVSLQNKLDNKELGGGGDSSVTLTQEEFELLSDEEKFNGLYYTYDTKRIYKNGVQYGANEPIELTMDEFKALKEAGALDEKQEYIITTNENGVLLEASDIGYNGTTSGLSSLSVQGAIDEVNDKIDNIIDDENVDENTVLSSKKTMEKITEHSLPLIYKTGNFVNNTVKLFKLANVIKDYTKTDFDNLNLLLSTRRGDEVELITGSDDNSNFVQVYRRSNATTKISAMYRDGYDIYVRIELYVNFFRVYHKSGNLPSNFEVIQVDTIPDTATEVAITPLPSIITTRSLTLKSGYAGYITEVYDPTTKVVVYNVNINGTFKGLGNSIATGFKIPNTASSGDDVMVSTIGIYGAVNTSTGDAQFTRLLIRNYGNPFFDVDAQGNFEISGTITYIAR